MNRIVNVNMDWILGYNIFFCLMFGIFCNGWFLIFYWDFFRLSCVVDGLGFFGFFEIIN